MRSAVPSELRDEVWRSNLRLVSAGLVTLSFGNASGIDRATGIVLIKPSGVAYDELLPEQLVAVSLDDGQPISGDLRPSSDLATHLALYRAYPAIAGIVHTHSIEATAWAQAEPVDPRLRDHARRPLQRTRARQPAADRRRDRWPVRGRDGPGDHRDRRRDPSRSAVRAGRAGRFPRSIHVGAKRGCRRRQRHRARGSRRDGDADRGARLGRQADRRRAPRAAPSAKARGRRVLRPGPTVTERGTPVVEVARLHAPRDVRVHREPAVRPARGEVRLRVAAVGLCGSDIHWYEDGAIGDARLQRPLVLGHEFVGVPSRTAPMPACASWPTPPSRALRVSRARPAGRISARRADLLVTVPRMARFARP